MTDNNFMFYVSDVLYNYDICTIDNENVFFLMSPLQWNKYNMPDKNLSRAKGPISIGFVMKF